MPFLDSQFIRPLYDVHEGGPPKAFLCVCNPTLYPGNRCNAVTRTHKGMVNHCRFKHGVKIQEEFTFEEIRPTTEP
jgi:hypothetical protein